MYLDSGGGTATNMSEFDVYAFTLSDFRLPGEAFCSLRAAEPARAEARRQQDDRSTPTPTASR